MIRAIALDEKLFPFNVKRPQLILLREEDGSVLISSIKSCDFFLNF